MSMTPFRSAAALLIAAGTFARAQPSHSAAAILESTIKALAPLHTVRYTVQTIPSPQIRGFMKGQTVVTGAVGLPFRYRARFQQEGAGEVTLAVSDGEKVRISAKGELSEYPTRAMEDRASADALPTLFVFDPDLYRKARAGGTAQYAGQDDSGGEHCTVLAVSTLLADEVGSDTRYIWISARTGLPRSVQEYRIFHGTTLLTSRWMISDIEANPETPPDVFRDHPAAADSKASEGKAEPAKPAEKTSPAGMQMPELETRDADYKPVSLAGITKGKVTLLTLWAPWCGPCIGEFSAFQAALDRHPGQFQVVALGVQDSRLNIVNYIGKHPEFKFVFLTDPHLEDRNSAISQFFPGKGIPRNVWIDPRGRIVEYHNGGYEVKEIGEKADRWVDLLK